MFTGAVNKKVVSQIINNLNLDLWHKIYIGCSGSFRIEQSIFEKFPNTELFSNDVSLMSCALGWALTNCNYRLNFKGDLEFLQQYADKDLCTRLAAIGVGFSLLSFNTKNPYGRHMREEVKANYEDLIKKNIDRVHKITDTLKISGFYPGDFLDQIDRAKENGGGFMSFAPTYKGGYERIYKALHEAIEWDSPTYGIWDPVNTHTILEKCNDLKIPYCVLTDFQIEGWHHKLEYRGSGHPVYVYTSEDRSSYRTETQNFKRFKYTLIEPQKITASSKVEILKVDNNVINYLKTIYLSKGINFVNSSCNFLVKIDGMLAGGFSYEQAKFGSKIDDLYLMSDFSLSRERKLSKLIAMLATSRSLINLVNRLWFSDIQRIYTTAFTNRPVSMKYRGIYQIIKRGEGYINYSSEVREMTPQEIFDEWFKKYGGKS